MKAGEVKIYSCSCLSVCQSCPSFVKASKWKKRTRGSTPPKKKNLGWLFAFCGLTLKNRWRGFFTWIRCCSEFQLDLNRRCVKVWGYFLSCVNIFPEIAASFSKGVHFNTFGGNPVACAIASSVLDVRPHSLHVLFFTRLFNYLCWRFPHGLLWSSGQTIQEDGTQQVSLDVGTHIMTQLAKLRDQYEIIGDVRGKGLQIGVEMVKDKVSGVCVCFFFILVPHMLA